jgi:tetratricopeptide (TPR) repeat protein
MKTSRRNFLLTLLIAVVLLSACGKEEPPAPTDTTAPSATPIPATPTPAVSIDDTLANAWQAYEEEDYQTARELVEEVRDFLKLSGEENGEVYGLLGLIELETGTTGSANFYFEKAQELGYENGLIAEKLSAGSAAVILEELDQMVTSIRYSYDPDEILSSIESSHELLDEYLALGADPSEVEEVTTLLNLHEIDPANYVEDNLTLEDIQNLMDRLSTFTTLNLHNNFIDSLEEDYPNNPIVLYVIGARHLWDEEYQKSIETLTDSLELEPGNEDAWVFLGYAYLNSGLAMHSRDAFTNSLLLNPDNEDAYEELAWLNNWRPYLINSDFSNYGFSFDYFPFSEFTPDGQVKMQAGIIENELTMNEGEDDEWSMLIRISWEDEGNINQTNQHLQEAVSNAMDVNSPGWKSNYETFDYGTVPMIYRDYGYRLPGSSSYADAIIAAGYCGTTTYVFDFRYLQDGTELDELRWYLMVSLESFSCDAD